MNEEDAEPTLARLRLGALLRAARESSEVSQADAAKALKASDSKISRIENGLLPVNPEDARRLLNRYGTSSAAQQEQAFALARATFAAGPWDAWTARIPALTRHALNIEAAASMIMMFDVAIPPILQIPAYEDALLAPARGPAVVGRAGELLRRGRGGLDARVLARRREIIRQRQPKLWLALDERALTRAPGGSNAILAAQLDSLIAVASPFRGLILNLIPASSPLLLKQAGPFSVFRIEEPEAELRVPDKVLLEHQTSLSLLSNQDDVDHYNVQFNIVAAQSLHPEPSEQALCEARQALQTAGRDPDKAS